MIEEELNALDKLAMRVSPFEKYLIMLIHKGCFYFAKN